MNIQLIDRNKKVCEAWEREFEGCNDVSIIYDDIFSIPTQCIVSPSNSFGFMDGGLDLIISTRLGWQVQQKLQSVIKEKYYGELLVGQAELIETENSTIPYCISAPTMRVPQILENTVNIYLATKAVFILLKQNPQIKTVSLSGLGTGVGRVNPAICARQMKQAYKDIWCSDNSFPTSWSNAQRTHQLLYTDKYRDLQFRKSK